MTGADRSPRIAEIAVADGTAVVPIGAYEQHGPHLPLATDALLAEDFARVAVEQSRVPVWLLPTLTIGASSEHLGFPGTVSLSSATLAAVCRDVAASVLASGVRRLVFVNAHGGNPELLQILCREFATDLGLRAMVVHAPDLPGPVRVAGDDGWDVHAGGYETSLMLALHPELVAEPLPAADGADAVAAFEAAQRLSLGGVARVPWRTSDLSSSGVIGDPGAADAIWGREMFVAQATALTEIIEQFALFRFPKEEAK